MTLATTPPRRLVLAALLATVLAACGGDESRGDECDAPADCPLPATLCVVPLCENGWCDITGAEPGTACGDGGTCNEQGSCEPQ